MINEKFKKNKLIKRSITACIFVPVLLFLTYLGNIPFILFNFLLLFLGVKELNNIVDKNKKYWKTWYYLGLFFVLFFCLNMISIRYINLHAALALLFIVWTTDTMAYFCGIIIGGPKLAGAISPNKTVSGFIGGVIFSALLCMILNLINFWQEQNTMFESILSGIFISVCSQAGDLAESAMKRYFNVKDSGTIIPGHGGILDRFDGMIFASFAMRALL